MCHSVFMLLSVSIVLKHECGLLKVSLINILLKTNLCHMLITFKVTQVHFFLTFMLKSKALLKPNNHLIN